MRIVKWSCCRLSGVFGIGSWSQEWVDLAGDISLEATDDFAAGPAFGETAFEVGAGGGVPAQPGQHDAIQRGVCLPVAAVVEAHALGLARGRFDRTGAAQGGEGRLTAEPLWVVAGGDQQGGGLNRGGDRAANNALWTIANNRMIHDYRTREFAQRRRQLGDSRNDTLRVLKRYIARETFAIIRDALRSEQALADTA
jgi:hypothetical protein